MCISIKRFKDSWGVESVVVKMGHTPLFWANLYATIQYRNVQKSPNTIEKVLRTIGMCYMWAKSEGIDFDDRVTKGDFLDINDVDNLSYFLKLRSDAQTKILEKKLEPSKNRIKKHESVRFVPNLSKLAPSFAGNEEIATRIRIAADYLEFHISRKHGNSSALTKESLAFRKYVGNNIAYIRQLIPRVRASSLNEDLEGLSEKQVEASESAFRPGTKSNPFRVGFHQHRNYLIWRMLFETGMRRHELTAIKVEDVNYGQHRVVIRISKTIARTVPISQSLSDFFHDYVMNYWSKLPHKSNKHGYLITAKDGRHLDIGSINLIFQTAREKVSEIPNELTPHSLRRTWNDRFSHRIDISPADQKPSLEQEKQIRNRLMGWSSSSSQAETYAKRHIRKKADEIAERLANELTDTNNGDKNG